MLDTFHVGYQDEDMTLMVGYARMRDSEPGIEAGQLFRKLADAGTVPVPPAHAVESGETQALCGEYVIVTDKPWPPAFGSRCKACREAVRTES